MKPEETFHVWVARELEIDDTQIESMRLDAAFDLLVSRFELARRRGSNDPVSTGSTKHAGGNSRLCTKRMLEHLGYTPAERRAVQRLLAGSASGWPGLLRLYAAGIQLSPVDRQYARRQLKVFSVQPAARAGRQ
ncbi:hypothetical protein [Pedococcus sp. 5OH_020]|uniref:hypothetical protein n=1 Tax=Pedococcus sp. 5OH_020 TaxID=2989814 RepID=UPI0022E9B408|nr:hypothetical protein [Pedococcus sp. 5OH_020]